MGTKDKGVYMKQYSFVQEFFGNCAAGLTSFEGGISKASKSITSKPVSSLLKKPKANRGNQTMRSRVYKKEKSLA